MPTIDYRLFFNNAPAKVSRAKKLENAQIYTSSPDFFSQQDWARYDALSRKAMRPGASNDDSDERRLGWYFPASALEGQFWFECALTTAPNISNADFASAGSSFNRLRSLVDET